MKALDVLKNVPQIIGRKGGNLTLICKKHSPEVLIGLGIAGGVTAAVMACKATRKLDEVMDEHNNAMCVIEPVLNSTLDEAERKKIKKHKANQCLKTGVSVAKLYAPSIGIGVASVACILGSYGIIHKRNVALAAAYSILNDRFSGYRDRVRDEFGDEKDKELYFGTHKEVIEIEQVGKNGKTKKVKETVNVGNPYQMSQYAVCFDDSSRNWENDPFYNKMFLTNMQNLANDKLRLNGHLFLNEVYDMLGIPRTPDGCVVGWVYDPNDENRDNYIDFGMFNIYNENSRDFVNGYESCVWLDFNVDGCIQNLI